MGSHWLWNIALAVGGTSRDVLLQNAATDFDDLLGHVWSVTGLSKSRSPDVIHRNSFCTSAFVPGGGRRQNEPYHRMLALPLIVFSMFIFKL